MLLICPQKKHLRSMLLLDHITKSYDHLLFNIPSVQIDGGISWIKGENGSGKTTLLKITAGLIPFEGDAVFQKISLKNNPVLYRQHIGWSEAEPLFPGFLSGSDLLSLYKNIRKASQKEISDINGFLNIKDYINDPIRTYSAGMLKKLSLALAFIGRPALVLLDEPFITLDEATCKTLCQYIGERSKTKECVFMLSSHQEVGETLLKPDREIIIAERQIRIR
jgi:ABC-2 type transport system ATP-binding protein